MHLLMNRICNWQSASQTVSQSARHFRLVNCVCCCSRGVVLRVGMPMSGWCEKALQILLQLADSIRAFDGFILGLWKQSVYRPCVPIRPVLSQAQHKCDMIVRSALDVRYMVVQDCRQFQSNVNILYLKCNIMGIIGEKKHK